MKSAQERFWSKVDQTPSCWIWTASTRVGYGKFWLDGRFVLAHRYAYELLVDPIPAGLQIDHLCRNPACVRPDHLEPVSPQINTLRGIGPTAENAAKTHCVAGHELTGSNLLLRPEGRECRACKASRDAVRLNGRKAIPCPICGKPRNGSGMAKHIRRMHSDAAIQVEALADALVGVGVTSAGPDALGYARALIRHRGVYVEVPDAD